MVYSLSYRRPIRISSSSASLSGDEKQKSINESISSGSSGMSHGIPEALSFDKIISGGACPPCTIRDFMNYLIYVEHSAENLQFFLWFRDYVQRFNALPESEKCLAPVWTEQVKEEAHAHHPRPKKVSAETAAVFKGTAFEPGEKGVNSEQGNPFHTPPATSSGDTKHETDSIDTYNDSQYPGSVGYAKKAETAFSDAGLKWKPFTVQPYREEISRIISIYIAEDGARQLNLSSKQREALMHSLEHTTHPSAFGDVLVTVEYSLRCQAHPNFIRWTICNGNRPRVIFARALGVGGIVGGFIAAILITLGSAGRAWRVMSFIGFFIGIATLIAAWKGMCVVLHGMHHRHLRPWELFAENDEGLSELDMKGASFESLGSSNSYEDEPWVAKYQKRNIVRKVFDREVWIQEPALRQIQDTIFLQAILGAFIVSAILVGIFCAFPAGGFY